MNKSFKSICLGLLLKILGRSLCISIMQSLRNMLYFTPMPVIQAAVKTTTLIPLWLSRWFVNLVTIPIGDERKWIHEIERKTWRGVWIIPKVKNVQQAEDKAVNNDLVIFYIHGGGFCMGHSKMYMETFQLIINHLLKEHHIKASILSLEYSLCPEAVWPKACDEAMNAYRYLIDTLGINPSKIVLAGDSAGGNLVATMLLKIKGQLNNEQDEPLLPAAAGLLSPFVDLTIDQPSFKTHKNDTLSSKQIAKYVPYYIPNYNNLDKESQLAMIRNPLISPLYGDFSGTCPIFLSYGDKELLRTSIENFKSKLEEDGCNVTTLRRQNATHVWLVYRLMAASREVYEEDCKRFINWIACVSRSVCNK